MTVENRKTHFLRTDYRYESLYQIITGLDHSIKVLENKITEHCWYDGDWFREESEPIYGLAFIAYQNYINSSIKDFSGSTNEKERYYKIPPDLCDYQKTSIELIIGLANYSKHKEEDGKLHFGTKEILECFKLSTDKEPEPDKSPVFDGLSVLNESWNLFEILEVVKNWRERLWSEEN